MIAPSSAALGRGALVMDLRRSRKRVLMTSVNATAATRTLMSRAGECTRGVQGRSHDARGSGANRPARLLRCGARMHPLRLTALALAFFLTALPTTARAGDENPLGAAVGFGTIVAPALAWPLLLSTRPLPRPGLGHWNLGFGWQSAPDSFVAVSNAGGYFGEAWWLGIEARADSRIDTSTGIDAHIDAAYYLLLRPTPMDLPVWVELLVGPSFETGFGANTEPYITGGPSLGVRAGFAIDFGSLRLVFEGDVTYNARWSDAYAGARHQVEGAGRSALLFDLEGADDQGNPAQRRAGVSLEYRVEVAITPELALPDTHRVVVGGIFAF